MEEVSQSHAPKRTQLSIDVKRHVCLLKTDDPGVTHEMIMDNLFVTFGIVIDRSTISKILKNSDKWLSARCGNRKRLRKGAFEGLEDAILDWISDNPEIKVTDNVIRDKAKELSLSFGIAGVFKASNGWLDGFRRRHGLSVRNKSPTFKQFPVLSIYNTQASNELKFLDIPQLLPLISIQDSHFTDMPSLQTDTILDIVEDYQHVTEEALDEPLPIEESDPLLMEELGNLAEPRTSQHHGFLGLLENGSVVGPTLEPELEADSSATHYHNSISEARELFNKVVTFFQTKSDTSTQEEQLAAVECIERLRSIAIEGSYFHCLNMFPE